MTQSVALPPVRKMQCDWRTSSSVKDIPQSQRGVKLGIFVPEVTLLSCSVSLSLQMDLALPGSQVGATEAKPC